MRKVTMLVCGTLLLGACNQGGDPDTKTTQSEAPATPKVNHYCFYKKDAQIGWTASRDAQGNVVVKGKAHVDDVRYKADLGQPDISGSSAKLWLSTTTNTSYAAPGNWWDVSFTIPNSSAIDHVTVNCDAERQFADLTVKPAKAPGKGG
ncbi:hypothetical protein [Sphingomonas sp.]|uniref:hypothetical protein n=1 Tax=Sphingomonas sp. TaxID=28214 RepID=UPI0025D4A837|nr:hypothetical protein [Sphingomonas sp.]MBV9527309.1 hypothetical protein [Sphingomonas sp.]